MPTTVSGIELGLANVRLNGTQGQGVQGQGGAGLYVNSVTGNLVLQQQDQILVGQGLDTGLIRTYNSLGRYNDDNGDNFRFAFNHRLLGLSGTINTPDSRITRIAGDGSESTFVYDAVLGAYVSDEGAGAHDTLEYNSTTGEWTYTEGSSQQQEIYDWRAVEGRLIRRLDTDGNATTFGYHANGFIDRITDASGQVMSIVYSGNNATEVRTTSESSTQTLVRYSYDSEDRLTQVQIDLSPEDNSVSDNHVYTTAYTYDGNSKRIASITQSDGTTTAFTYDSLARVATVSEGGQNVITYSYTDSATVAEMDYPLLPDALTIPESVDQSPYYSVLAGDTWSSLASTFYQTTDATAVSQLESHLMGLGYTLTAGESIPQSAFLANVSGEQTSNPEQYALDTGDFSTTQLSPQTYSLDSSHLSSGNSGPLNDATLSYDAAITNDNGTLTKTGESGWGGGALHAAESMAGDLSVEFTLAAGGGKQFIHLQDPNGGGTLYTLQVLAGGYLQVVDHGEWQGNLGPFDLGGVVRMERSNGVMTFSHEGEVFYSSAQVTDTALRFEGFIYNQGDRFGNFSVRYGSGGAEPYYPVTAGDTWDSIATLLYGAGTGDELAAHFAAQGITSLSAGDQLTGFPPSLTDDEATATVVPYYAVQVGDTWASLTQAFYHTSDTSVAGQLQVHLAGLGYSLSVGESIPQTAFPASLSVQPTTTLNTSSFSTTEVSPQTYTLDNSGLQQSSGGGVTFATFTYDGAITDDNGTLTKTAESGWGGGSFSADGSMDDDGAVEFTLNDGGGTQFIHIQGPNGGGALYTLQILSGGYLQVVDHGEWQGNLGPFAAGGAVRLERSAGVMTFSYDGEVFYTSTQVTNSALSIEGYIFHQGDRFEDIQVSYGSESGETYYEVTASDTWDSIATQLYGAGTGDELAAHYAAQGITSLSVGDQLTGFPPSLTDDEATATVAPYYSVQATDTWASLAQSLYDTSDASVASKLQAHLTGLGYSLSVGESIPQSAFPATLSVVSVALLDNTDFSTTAVSPQTYPLASSALSTSGGATVATLSYDDSVSNDNGTITKVAETGWAGGAFYADGSMADDGAVEFTLADGGGRQFIHLQGPNGGGALYTLQVLSGGYLQVVDHGEWQGNFGPFALGGVVQMERSAGVMTFSHEGEVFYTSAQTTNEALSVEGYIYHQGDNFGNFSVRYGSGGVGESYYPVTAGDTWDSIATLLYGAGTGDALAAYFAAQGITSLSDGDQLTGFPSSLTDDEATVTVDPYYQVQSGDTWASLTQGLYNSTEATVVSQLQTHLTDLGYSLSVGEIIPQNDFPGSLALESSSSEPVDYALQTDNFTTPLPTSTGPFYYEVSAGDTWASIALALYDRSEFASELETLLSGQYALTEGEQIVEADLPGVLVGPAPVIASETTITDALGYETTYRFDTEGRTVEIIRPTVTAEDITQQAYGLILELLTFPDPSEEEEGDDTPYYLVGADATWASVTTELYVNSDAQAVEALQAHLSNLGYTLAEGEQIPETDLPSPLSIDIVPKTTFTYDGEDNLLSMTDEQGHTTRYEYDERGNRVLEQDAEGNTLSRSFSATNQVLTETQYRSVDDDLSNTLNEASDSQTTHFVYDAEEHLRFSVSALGRVQEYRYDTAGNRVATLAFTDASYNGTDFTEAELATWSAAQDQTSIQRVDSRYDFRGQITAVTTYAATDSDGAGIIDGTESTTEFIYDQNGRLLETIAANGVATSAPGDSVTTYLYDGLGRLLAMTDALGRVTASSYSDAGQSIQTTAASGLITTTLLDSSGRVISVSEAEGATPLGTTSFAYDANGNQITATDPNGNQVHRLYDALGRERARIDAEGSLVELRYDNDTNDNLSQTLAYATALTAGQITSLLDAAAAGTTEAELTSLTSSIASAQDRTAYNFYDAADRLTHSVDSAGALTQYVYDGMGQLSDTIAYANRIDTSGFSDSTTAANISPSSSENDRHSRFFYDDDGLLIGTLDADGFLTENLYDQAGQLIETIAYANASDETLRANADFATLKASITLDPSQDLHTHNIYDGKGQLIANLDEQHYLTEFAYDANGNQTQVVRYATQANAFTGSETLGDLRPAVSANDQVTQTTYTQLDQISQVTTLANTSAITTTDYTYDEIGQLTSTTRAVGTEEARTTRARYDVQGRLIGELTGEGSGALDALVDPTPADIDALWADYGMSHTYDQKGRRTSTTDANGHTTYFYYDSADRLVLTVNPQGEVSQIEYNTFGETERTLNYLNRIDTLGLVGGVVTADLITRLNAAGNTNQSTETFEDSANPTTVINLTITNEQVTDATASTRIDGTEASETLTGLWENESLYGRGGDDTLQGGEGSDHLYGDNGADLLYGGAGTDTLYGGNHNDSLYGGIGNDTLQGQAGDDVLVGGSGNDNLYGQTGNDTYVFEVNFGRDTIDNANQNSDNLTTRSDIILFGEGIATEDILLRRSGDSLLIVHRNGNDQISVSNHFSTSNQQSRIDAIHFSDATVWTLADIAMAVEQATPQDDSFYGNATADNLSGGEGNDILQGRDGDDVLSGGEGSDTLYGDDQADTLFGGAGSDTLRGGNDDDQLYGDSGNDNLNGNTGNDRLVGGAGNDSLYGDMGNDTYYFEGDFGQDNIYNTAGIDVVEFGPGINPGDIDVYRYSTRDLRLRHGESDNWVTISNYFNTSDVGGQTVSEIRFADSTIWTWTDIEPLLQPWSNPSTSQSGDSSDNILIGGRDNDTLSGNDGDDDLQGLANNDNLSGGLGNDRLEGGTGNDTLRGDAGNDTYFFARGFGQDAIYNDEANLTAEDVIEFAADINPSDIRITHSSNDLLLQLRGTDDQVRVYDYFRDDAVKDPSRSSQSVVDLIRFNDGTEWDIETVKSLVQLATDSHDSLHTYGAGGLLAGGDGDDNLFGSDGDDTLQGGAHDDDLRGYDGNDILEGGNGADYLSGDGGNDLLYGGAGYDTLIGGDGDDLLMGGSGNDSLQGYDGNDIYRFELGFGQDTINNLESSISAYDVIEFGDGILPEDILIARSGSNLILTHDNTDDRITVSNFFTNDAIKTSSGYQYVIDGVRFTDGSEWDIDTMKRQVLLANNTNQSIYGYNNTPNQLQGGAGADSLTGRDQDDYLAGGTGNDTLWGYGGDDTLVGGAGNESIYGGDGNDLIQGDSGSDTLRGEDGSDQLFGGTGSDTLEGGDGDDLLVGGQGNDQLRGGNGNDIYRFGLGFGSDTVNNSYINSDPMDSRLDVIEFDHTIAVNDIQVRRDSTSLKLIHRNGQDVVTVSSFFNSDATTQYHIDEVRFNDGSGTVWDTASLISLAQQETSVDDKLYSNTAGNTLNGADGNDILTGANGVDILYGDRGNDTLWGYANADHLYGGLGNDTLRGGNENDQLFGGAGNDYLYAEYGDDLLVGNQGNDIFYGGSGNDIHRFSLGFGHDNINNSYLNYDAIESRLDVIEFDHTIEPADIQVLRDSTNLILAHHNTEDRLTVTQFFNNDGASQYHIDEVRFNDGTVWNTNQLMLMVQVETTVDDRLYSNTTGDTLNGGQGNDTLYGDDGVDSLYGEQGSDSLWGYDNADQLFGGIGNDTLRGGDGDDQLYGGANNDTLYGSGDNDLLVGGDGNDYLYGGSGNDVYRFGMGFGSDTIDNSSGNSDAITERFDIIEFDSTILVSDIQARRTNRDLLLVHRNSEEVVRVQEFFRDESTSQYMINEIHFNDGTVWDIATVRLLVQEQTAIDDELYSYEAGNTLSAAEGNDRLYGDDGVDILSGESGNDTLTGGDNDDQLYGGLGNDQLYGNAGNDQLFGGLGVDDIRGGEGDDYIVGGAGNDQLYGQTGNDTYYFAPGFGYDSIYNGQWNSQAASSQLDVVQFAAGINPSDVQIEINSSSLHLHLSNSGDRLRIYQYFSSNGNSNYSIDEIRFDDGTVWRYADIVAMGSNYTVPTSNSINGTESGESLTGDTNHNTIRGYGGDDNLTGLSGNDSLQGGEGNDTLYGGLGNDTLTGSSGNDLLEGGAGNDSLYGNEGDDIYRFELGFGQDTIYNQETSITAVDTVVFGAGLSPSDANASRTGNDLLVSFNTSDDSLRISGYFTNEATKNVDDLYHYLIDQIQFDDGTSWDVATVLSLVEQSSDTHNTLYSTGTGTTLNGQGGNDNLYGNDNANTLQGGSGNDSLSGYDGNDLLEGGTGNDTFSGGDGNDTLLGGYGNDTLRGGAGDDVLQGDSGNDSLRGESGNDIYRFALGFGQDTINNYETSETAVDTIEFTAGILPSDIAVVRSGTSLILRHQNGADQITVSSYFTNDAVKDPDAPWYWVIDAIRFDDGTEWDVNTIKAMVQVGSQTHDRQYSYDVGGLLTGLDGDDSLYGEEGIDTLEGGAGADLLYGRENNDALSGEAGADTLYGDEGEDTLDGGEGNDTLHGGAGNDLLIGGSGNDYLRGDEGDDTYRFDLGFGQDTVTPSTNNNDIHSIETIEFTAGISPSDFELLRSGDSLILQHINGYDKVTVSSYFYDDAIKIPERSWYYLIDSIRFADGTEWDVDYVKEAVRQGSSSHDSQLRNYDIGGELYGGDGNDNLYGDSQGHGIDVLRGGEGNDTIYGYDNDDRLYGDAGDDSLRGGDQNDQLFGGTGNDSLWAGSEDDLLHGGAGNDTLYGETGDDILVGGLGNDNLYGGQGNDIYRFARGFGADSITNSYSNSTAYNQRLDIIQFAHDILPNEIAVVRNNNDLYLELQGSEDRLRVLNFFSSDGISTNVINEIHFGDGTV